VGRRTRKSSQPSPGCSLPESQLWVAATRRYRSRRSPRACSEVPGRCEEAVRSQAILTGLLFAACLRSQTGNGTEGIPDVGDPCCMREGYPRTVEEMLERREIPLTKQGLALALPDSRPEVRSLAARKFAQDKDKDGISLIAQALQAEKAPGTREFMAYALASLGELQGTAALRELCKTGFSHTLRMTAAEDMLNLHDESCVDDLLQVVRTSEDSTSANPLRDNLVQVGLSGVGGFQLQHLSEHQSEEIRELAVRALGSKAAQVRLAAARALARFGNSASVPALRKAVDEEQDSSSRPRMLEALKTLEERQSGPADEKK